MYTDRAIFVLRFHHYQKNIPYSRTCHRFVRTSVHTSSYYYGEEYAGTIDRVVMMTRPSSYIYSSSMDTIRTDNSPLQFSFPRCYWNSSLW